MAGGAARSFGAAWLGLVVLQAVTTKRGSGAVAGGFGVLGGIANRALSPDVAAIPDRAHATGREEDTTPTTPPTPTPKTPAPAGSGPGVVPNFDRLPNLPR